MCHAPRVCRIRYCCSSDFEKKTHTRAPPKTEARQTLSSGIAKYLSCGSDLICAVTESQTR